MTNGYERSEEITALAGALAKAQGAMSSANKGGENPHFKNRYADLADCWDACRGPSASNGLSVVQPVCSLPDGAVGVTTLLLHESGEFLSHTLEITPVKQDPQGLGSVITYARRYGLCAMVGIAPDDDDDGNAASGKGKSNGNGASATRPATPAGLQLTETPGRVVVPETGQEVTVPTGYSLVTRIVPAEGKRPARITFTGFAKTGANELVSIEAGTYDEHLSGAAELYRKAHVPVAPTIESVDSNGRTFVNVTGIRKAEDELRPEDDGENTEAGRKRDIDEARGDEPPPHGDRSAEANPFTDEEQTA